MSASHSGKKDDKQSDYIIIRLRDLVPPEGTDTPDQETEYYSTSILARLQAGHPLTVAYHTTPDQPSALYGKLITQKRARPEDYFFTIIRSDNPHIVLDPENQKVTINNTFSKADIVYAGTEGASKLQELIDDQPINLYSKELKKLTTLKSLTETLIALPPELVHITFEYLVSKAEEKPNIIRINYRLKDEFDLHETLGSILLTPEEMNKKDRKILFDLIKQFQPHFADKSKKLAREFFDGPGAKIVTEAKSEVITAAYSQLKQKLFASENQFIMIRLRTASDPIFKDMTPEQLASHYKKAAISVIKNIRDEAVPYSNSFDENHLGTWKPLRIDSTYLFVVIKSDNANIQLDPKTKKVSFKNSISEKDLELAYGQDYGYPLRKDFLSKVEANTVVDRKTNSQSQTKSTLFQAAGTPPKHGIKVQAPKNLDLKHVTMQNKTSKK